MPTNKKRALIVDDNKAVLALLKAYLNKRDYEVEEAESGETAVDIFKERGLNHGFDIIIIDHIMPGIDGLTAFKEIQKTDSRLPAIMLTGFSSINLAVRFIQQGGINFLTKPFDSNSELLALAIGEALNYKRITRAQVSAVQESSSELLTFRDENAETEASQAPCKLSPWKMLIIDDDEAIHGSTRLLLEKFVFDGRLLEFYSVYSAGEAKSWLDDNPDVALVLVDTVMETEFAGFDVIKHIRKTMGNSLIRIILRAERYGELPVQKVVLDYEIDGYLAKQDVSIQRLIIMVTTAIRAYRDLMIIEKERQETVIELEAAHHEKENLETRIKKLEYRLSGMRPMASLP